MSKSLLVIGASSEVGSALINRVVDKYDIVVAHYNHWNDNLQYIKHQYSDRIKFIQADLSNSNQIIELIETIKREHLEPDHIVHFPAPKLQTQKFTKTDWKAFNDGWNLSVYSAVILIKEFIQSMHKKKYGKVVFMLTSCTLDIPPKYQTAYTTVKYALLGLMKSLASEYADKGITINGVSPDMIQTKYLTEIPKLMIEQYAEKKPLKKILSVEDVIPTLDFLLSDGADHINGENIGVI